MTRLVVAGRAGACGGVFVGGDGGGEARLDVFNSAQTCTCTHFIIFIAEETFIRSSHFTSIHISNYSILHWPPQTN